MSTTAVKWEKIPLFFGLFLLTGQVKWAVEVIQMKKRYVFLSFLCGLALPVLMMTWAGRQPQKEEIQPSESIQEEPTQTTQTEGTEEELPAGIVMTVLAEDGQVVQMKVDAYLQGVVLSEMPASFHSEALKAQSVVARTYALKRLYHGGKHEQAAVCMISSCCQGYISPEDYINQGGSQESVDKVLQAVEQTHGQVLTYDGELIDATYFASSGGSTESAVEVWGRDVPYLQATDSPGEEESAVYAQTVSFTAEEFAQCLGFSPSGDAADWIGQVSYTDGDGVAFMEICGSTYSGTELREKLGLRSTVFTVVGMGDMLIVQTRGFGHRVGMSQYGAQAMAEQGSTYDTILTHYYKGTAVTLIEEA